MTGRVNSLAEKGPKYRIDPTCGKNPTSYNTVRATVRGVRALLNWDLIESEWHAGELSNVKLAVKHGISEGAIRKRARDEGWVKGEITKRKLPPVDKPKAERAASAIVDNMTVDLAHRMLEELDIATSLHEELTIMIESETEDDRTDQRRKFMMKMVSLPTRAATLKVIQQTLAAELAIKKPEGKKGQQAEAARQAAAGRFSAPQAPKLKAVK